MVSEPATSRYGDRAHHQRLTREAIRLRLDLEPQELRPLYQPFQPAAVLFPIIEREDLSVLLTRRTEHLSSHAGQVCFPGGRLHADETLVETALREMEEETGVGRSAIDLAGFLTPYDTLNTGFTILPVVGFLGGDIVLKPNAEEVAEAFEAPLDYLLDPTNHERKFVERGGVLREFHAIAYGSHTIWGATAAMIVNLSERLGRR